MEKKIHEGHNVKRIREMMGLKPDGLAMELGDDWTEKKIYLLEQKETIEPGILKKVSEALKVPVEAIQQPQEDHILNSFTNTFNDHAQLSGFNWNNNNSTFHFNALEKLLEAMQEIKRLNEILLKAKEEQIAYFENIIAGLKK